MIVNVSFAKYALPRTEALVSVDDYIKAEDGANEYLMAHKELPENL